MPDFKFKNKLYFLDEVVRESMKNKIQQLKLWKRGRFEMVLELYRVEFTTRGSWTFYTLKVWGASARTRGQEKFALPEPSFEIEENGVVAGSANKALRHGIRVYIDGSVNRLVTWLTDTSRHFDTGSVVVTPLNHRSPSTTTYSISWKSWLYITFVWMDSYISIFFRFFFNARIGSEEFFWF